MGVNPQFSSYKRGMTNASFYGLVLAAGKGARLGGTPKQYRQLHGRDIWLYPVLALAEHANCQGGVIICPDGENEYHSVKLAEYQLKNWIIVTGGIERQDSVRAGLEALHQAKQHIPSFNCVLIHDAARPFIDLSLIDQLISAYQMGYQAVIPALPPADSLKKVHENLVKSQIDREQVMRVQTPQLFDFDLIHDLHQRYAGGQFTDDSALAQEADIPVYVVEGAPQTFKITTEADWIMAQRLSPGPMMENRIGYGYDVHQFSANPVPNSTIMLCGVAIPHDHHIIAHSDGDVALHALTDAILGAISDGDIGVHFPPSDEKWKNACSDQFLADACQRLRAQHGRVINCDITIIAESPKITPHRENMRQKLSSIMGISINRISIKATTSETMGFVGRREGIAAHAMVSISLPSG